MTVSLLAAVDETVLASDMQSSLRGSAQTALGTWGLADTVDVSISQTSSVTLAGVSDANAEPVREALELDICGANGLESCRVTRTSRRRLVTRASVASDAPSPVADTYLNGFLASFGPGIAAVPEAKTSSQELTSRRRLGHDGCTCDTYTVALSGDADTFWGSLAGEYSIIEYNAGATYSYMNGVGVYQKAGCQDGSVDDSCGPYLYRNIEADWVVGSVTSDESSYWDLRNFDMALDSCPNAYASSWTYYDEAEGAVTYFGVRDSSGWKSGGVTVSCSASSSDPSPPPSGGNAAALSPPPPPPSPPPPAGYVAPPPPFWEVSPPPPLPPVDCSSLSDSEWSSYSLETSGESCQEGLRGDAVWVGGWADSSWAICDLDMESISTLAPTYWDYASDGLNADDTVADVVCQAACCQVTGGDLGGSSGGDSGATSDVTFEIVRVLGGSDTLAAPTVDVTVLATANGGFAPTVQQAVAVTDMVAYLVAVVIGEDNVVYEDALIAELPNGAASSSGRSASEFTVTVGGAPSPPPPPPAGCPQSDSEFSSYSLETSGYTCYEGLIGEAWFGVFADNALDICLLDMYTIFLLAPTYWDYEGDGLRSDDTVADVVCQAACCQVMSGDISPAPPSPPPAPCNTLTDSQWTDTSYEFFHDVSCNDLINNGQLIDMIDQATGTRLTRAELCAKTMQFFQENSVDPDTGDPTWYYADDGLAATDTLGEVICEATCCEVAALGGSDDAVSSSDSNIGGIVGGVVGGVVVLGGLVAVGLLLAFKRSQGKKAQATLTKSTQEQPAQAETSNVTITTSQGGDKQAPPLAGAGPSPMPVATPAPPTAMPVATPAMPTALPVATPAPGGMDVPVHQV